MTRNMLLLLLMVSTALFGNAEASAVCPSATGSEQKVPDAPAISETDTYLDLNTGKQFRIIYDGLNEKYDRDDLFELELYVNTRTRDTFWLEQAILVNNALLRDEAGTYKVDPMKVKRNGSGYKVINNKVEMKVNDNEIEDKQNEKNSSVLPGAVNQQ